MIHLLTILITAILLENFVLNQILGICPFIGVSNKMDSAVGMGLAVTFVMLLAGVSKLYSNSNFLELNKAKIINPKCFPIVK